MNPYIICISGTIGSGKSTLGKNLSTYLKWNYLPESMHGIDYLSDLFINPKKWAFETQISFLSEKSLQLMRKKDANIDIILDRSIQEDVEIFAKYFYDNNYIDERSWKTYLMLSSFFLSQETKPDIILYCDCSYEVSLQRIQARKKRKNLVHPNDHIKDIYNRYPAWLRSITDIPLYRIDSSKYDFRDDLVVHSIIKDLQDIIFNPNDVYSQQLALFKNDEVVKKNKLLVLEEIVPWLVKDGLFVLKNTGTSNIPMKPYVYIAAPFTSIAEMYDDNDHIIQYTNKLFPFQRMHGKIPKGAYRKTLLKIVSTLKRYGLKSFLPHRDVNKWGNIVVSPMEVVRQCNLSVLGCDFFIGIIGESHGAHYELGLAHGRKVPVAIIRCKEIQGSFILSGFTKYLENTAVFDCNTISEIPSIIESASFQEFLNTYLELHK